MLYGFTTTEAVALSNFVIFLGGATRFAFEFNQNHPIRKAKLVDYGIVIVMLPAVMLGSFIGVQINVIAPSAIILGLLAAILLFISVTTMQKGYSLAREEQQKELVNKMDSEFGNPEENSEELIAVVFKRILFKPQNIFFSFTLE